MKLRDRQEKVERMLSFYKTSKGGPFQETSTHVRGQMDFMGSLLVMGDINQQNLDIISRAGIKTGIDSRFVFETTIGNENALAAEFVATQKGKESHGDVLEMPLSLAKLSYTTHVNGWLSLMAVPVGAQCKDVAVGSNSFDQVLFSCVCFSDEFNNVFCYNLLQLAFSLVLSISLKIEM
jgi:hypothetical protein